MGKWTLTLSTVIGVVLVVVVVVVVRGVNPMYSVFNFDWQVPQTLPPSPHHGAPLSLLIEGQELVFRWSWLTGEKSEGSGGVNGSVRACDVGSLGLIDRGASENINLALNWKPL